MKRLVSEQMVEYLERRDTEYIFGLCGHTVIGFLDALSRKRSFLIDFWGVFKKSSVF